MGVAVAQMLRPPDEVAHYKSKCEAQNKRRENVHDPLHRRVDPGSSIAWVADEALGLQRSSWVCAYIPTASALFAVQEALVSCFSNNYTTREIWELTFYCAFLTVRYASPSKKPARGSRTGGNRPLSLTRATQSVKSSCVGCPTTRAAISNSRPTS